MKNKLSILFLLSLIFAFSCTEKKQKVESKPDLKAEIEKIIKGKNATVAVSILDFQDNFALNINGDKHLPMQSVYKFHIALAVLNLVDEGKLNLEQKIFIKKSELLENTWSPIREKYPNGNIELSLSEIIKYTVAQSDNSGCDILLRLIGGVKTVQDFMNSKGIKDFQIKYSEEEAHEVLDRQYENYSSTNSIAELLEKFNKNEIVSKSSTDFLYNIMLGTTTCPNRLRRILPKNAKLANKTGTSFTKDGLTAATNDSGIVTLPNGKKYVIVVFVSDSKENETTNEKIISDISKVMWDFLNKQ